MIDRITVGAASLMGALTLGTGLVRYAVTPPRETGRHRAPRVRQVLDDASLDELLGPWPEPVHGAAFAQAWGDCPLCRKATPGVLHKDGWTCGECLEPVWGAR